MKKHLSFLHFDRNIRPLSALFASLSLLICCIFYDWWAGIFFGGFFLLAGSLRLTPPKSGWLTAVFTLFAAYITCMSTALLVRAYTFFTASPSMIGLNMLIYLMILGGAALITGNWRCSFFTASILLTLFGTVNGLVYEFRGNELAVSDLLSLSTALSVLDGYRLTIPASMAYGWLLELLLLYSHRVLPPCPPLRRRAVLAAELLAALVLFPCAKDIPIQAKGHEGSKINGTYLNFGLGIRDQFVTAPDNYSAAEASAIAGEFHEAENNGAGPNVLVIMCESFADFRVIGALDTNIPVTPFLDSLCENTIRGYALTSVFGGNTANAEFEFLTGHSMLFLPTGTVPYQQYLHGDSYSLARLMESFGYTSAATHPYRSNGWFRSEKYPLLGFSESTFLESYPQEDLIRGYVSDREMFQHLLGQLDRAEPLFLFGITMQNHGGYNQDYSGSITLEGYEGSYPQAEQYLSLIHETDSALEALLTALEEFPEDTVVLFFGDHFPKVEEEFYEELMGGPFDTLEKQILQYTVPFFIWANYDIDEAQVELTSLNYLARYLLEAAGLELPPYYQFLKQMESQIPAMNALGYYDGAFVPRSEAQEDAHLNPYAIIQHNAMFDPGHRAESFFGSYIN